MKLINITLVKEVIEKAQTASRKRHIKNFHDYSQDTIQRMLNAIEPDSYVRPHKHEFPAKREVFLVLTGKIAVLIFDNMGNITNFTVLNKDTGIWGIEIEAGVWHSLLSLESGSVLYEIKDGPYDETTDKQFAAWAPEENTREAALYLSNLKKQIL